MMYLPAWRPDLVIHPSRRWLFILSLLVGVCIVWISFWQLPYALRALLMLFVLGYGYRVWRTSGTLRTTTAIGRIRLEDDGWYLHHVASVAGPYQLAPSTWIQSGFVWLVFQALPGQSATSRRVLLCSDSVNKDDYRRLQGFLRWQDPATVIPLRNQTHIDPDM